MSVTIPTSSNPIFSIFASIPTAESTISHSIVSSPFSVFTFTKQPLPEVSTDSTEEFVLILIPDFLNDFESCFETSTSSIGTMLGKYSTIVTSVPIVFRNMQIQLQ